MSEYVFVFPGQGSQYIGMGSDLISKYELVKRIYTEANEILGFDILKICQNGPEETLIDTKIAQPAVFLHSYASFSVLTKVYGISPKLAAGHSLGEVTALICAGVTDFEDGLNIVKSRGEIMANYGGENKGGMLAILGLDIKIVEDICKELSQKNINIELANINTDKEIIVSGTLEALKLAEENIQAKGGKPIPLKVSAPFHSSYMKEAAELFEEELTKYTFRYPNFPVVSSYDAHIIKGNSVIMDVLKRQIPNAVNWKSVLDFLQDYKVSSIIEAGPGNILSKMVNRYVPEITTWNIDNNISEIKNDVGSFEPVSFIGLCLATAVSTKNTNLNEDEYRVGVVEPYVELQKLNDENKGQAINEILKERCVDLLTKILSTKNINKRFQSEIVAEIYDRTAS